MFISGHGKILKPSSVCRTFMGFFCLFLAPKFIKCDEKDELPKSWKVDRLRLQLFTNYDKNVHPMMNEENQTIVNIGLLLDYIDVSELQGHMILHGWLSLNWWDIDRIWNPSDFDNQKSIDIKPSEVWTPDVNLYQSFEENKHYQNFGEAAVNIKHDGSFRWVPSIVCTVFCKLNLRLWPYDEQKCQFRIGLWDLSRLEGSFLNQKPHGLSESFKSTEWDITSVQWKHYNTSDLNNYIEYNFRLMRRSSVYRAVVITPITGLILLSLCIFWVPPYMSEKLLLNAVLIILNTAFLMYFTQLLPVVAENTPLIVHFYSYSLLLLSLSTVETVVVLYLSTINHKLPLPQVIKSVFSGCLGRTLLITQLTCHRQLNVKQKLQDDDRSQSLDQILIKDLENFSTSPTNIGENNITNSENLAESTEDADINRTTTNSQQLQHSSIQYDWILLAIAVDRFSFLMFFMIYIILIIVYAS